MAEPLFDLAGRRVYVAGHRGMVGAALVRRLATEGCAILTAARAELDLTQPAQVEAWFARMRPEAVFVAAARVGGILENDTRPADFLHDNLLIQANLLKAAHESGVGKLLFLGSSCIYPRLAPQPIVEEALLTGPLEPTNEAYAVAKIAGIKLCQAYRRQHGADFIAAMPANLYGPGDTFDLASGHVLPALIRKAEEARRSGAADLVIWGTGTPRREFLHVDDCADACVHLMKVYSGAGPVNVGSGEEIAILDLARLVARLVGFEGRIVRDLTRPDGTPRKLMNSDRLRATGWAPRIGLEEGIAEVCRAWCAAAEGGRGAAA
ncbi:GDP-L-fucose synthase family protein [Ensifer soli]|uniref:GDP-L-fucose synthase family protein n=1 Tax=Ciceribacter sp. sgz301302 TaxID=3342379 RepID=UPI0035B8AA58